jgi:hypothetical protein
MAKPKLSHGPAVPLDVKPAAPAPKQTKSPAPSKAAKAK